MVEINRELILKVAAVIFGVLILAYLIDRYMQTGSIAGFTDGSSATDSKQKSPAESQPGTSSNLLTTLTSSMAAEMDAAGGTTGQQTAAATGGSTSGFADFGQYASAEGSDSMMGAGPVPQGAPGCFPRQQIQSADLLPSDKASAWAKSNPMGSGDLNMKNFLAAGYHIGVDSIGQSKKNGNWSLRSDPPIPQMPVGPWNNSPYQKDEYRRTFELQ